MTECYSADGRILAPYAMTSCVGPFWDKWFSEPNMFRRYTHGKSNSAQKAAYRFSMILRKNARWLDGSSSTDIDVLLQSWQAKMLCVSVYFKENGINKNDDLFNRPVNPLLNFWGFHDGGCYPIHYLSCLQLGIDPDGSIKADEDRRKEKATILREFHAEVKDWIKRVAYRVGSGPDSNRRLTAALEVGRQALAQADEVIDWEND